MKFKDIEQVSNARYAVTVPWSSIERTFSEYREGFSLDLDPPYQRGHVWSQAQQISYVEFILRGGSSGRDLYFNCPGFVNHIGDNEMTLVDGKQRLTAALLFLDNEIPAYGHLIRQYEDKPHTLDHSFIFHVNDLEGVEVLKWYIHLNSGIAHTEEELDRVRRMIVTTSWEPLE